MNNSHPRSLLNAFNTVSVWRSHLLISLVFLILFAAFFISLGRYWQNTLQPRLYSTAETQAKIIAQSQVAILVEVLEHSKAEQLAQKFYDALQEILLVEDPAIGGRIVTGIALQIDYDLVDAAPASLDLREGDTRCVSCFQISLPLINHVGELLGVADISISDKYFVVLSGEMKSKLYAESSVALGLLAAVWIAMLIMFHRLHRAKQAIEASDRAKTRFIANVTHELRTPLNAILGYTQIYKTNDALMERHGQGINTIDRCAEHLLLLINDILDFSRVDEANLKLYPREVGLENFLKTLIEMAAVSARLKSIGFNYHFPEQLPVSVAFDDKRLRQVLLNLLNNAVKFTDKGEVVFGVEKLSAKSPNTVHLRFSVSDSGIGIPAAELKNIFIAFHQVDNPITRAEGSGLGLAISQRLAKLMGSRLQVESSPEQGSRFWFDLELPVLANAGNFNFHQLDSSLNTPATLHLPSLSTRQRLIELAQQHNILGVRAAVRELAEESEFREFHAQLQTYVNNYRFKPLVEWLKSLEESY
ncbi:sensor histidine kinase [Cellvibrio sp. NN19]|uniref:sensor histidine kinase n=1 Tax=Cellvibrio chitinivorans TaxID=3102792 RepID=UPI002B409A0D|nr:ATP-binding protein [Cellvibrio sp. NN19]